MECCRNASQTARGELRRLAGESRRHPATQKEGRRAAAGEIVCDQTVMRAGYVPAVAHAQSRI